MTRRRTAVTGSGDSAAFTNTLLDWLGLPSDAGPDDIEAAHDRLVAFLDSAPPGLQPWARQQATAAGAAYAVLSGRETDSAGATGRDDRTTAADDNADALDDLTEDDFDEDDFDEDDLDPDEPVRATSGKHPASARQGRGRAAEPRKRMAQRPTRSHPRQSAPPALWRRMRNSRVFPVVLMLVVAGLVYGVYQVGGGAPSNTGAKGNATASPTAQPLDEAKVAELMTKLQANPKDVDTLRSLGDVYFQASDYKTAATWQQKIIDINPKDINARLALGVALFNTGDTAGAEQHWLKAVEIDPNQAEAHYDLGFLHLSKNPPDNAKAKAEWEQVIKIDPNSELAKTVSNHMDSLTDPSPSATSPAGGK